MLPDGQKQKEPHLGVPIGFEKPVLKQKFWHGLETGLKNLKPVLLQYNKMVKKGQEEHYRA